jgi:hypothetical protein
MKKTYIIVIIVVIVGLALFFTRQYWNPAFKTETDKSGEVTVKVVPQFEEGIAFQISMTAHAGELSTDMMRAAVFEDEDGTVHLPTAWEGDPPGGHHREGILRFGTFTPMPKKVDFTLLDIGSVKERKFSWMVPQK